jgi:hypothetical protein
MNQPLVDRVVNAVLYEGFILYPYRPSVKNRHRWTFGGLYPPAYCRGGADAPSMQTECLVLARPGARLSVQIRFLHLMQRTVGQLNEPLDRLHRDEEPPFRAVPSLKVDDKVFHTWQEAVERRIDVDVADLQDLALHGQTRTLRFPAFRLHEPITDSQGRVAAALVREQQAIEGSLEVSAESLEEYLYRMRVKIANTTAISEKLRDNRDEMVLRTLVSTHTILSVQDGEFVSLLDPPEAFRGQAASCQNIGTWPVLVGEDGTKDTMLSSPIILYDYPQVAPESPGDLFDCAEIDEILTLRILTLTDDEKREMEGLDIRARSLLDRTENLSSEDLLRLHGTIRMRGS